MEEDNSVCNTASGRFRWLLLMRFTVALVVIVVAAVVLVKGLSVVLAPRVIDLNISQSNVFVELYRITNHTRYKVTFYLEAKNPSELFFIYYRNIIVRLFYTTPDPAPGSPPSPPNKLLAKFDLFPSSLSLSQKEEHEFLAHGHTDNIAEVAVGKLFTNGTEAEIRGAVMQLSGALAMYNIKQGVMAPYHSFKYNCQPVVVKSKAPLPTPSSENYKAICRPTGFLMYIVCAPSFSND